MSRIQGIRLLTVLALLSTGHASVAEQRGSHAGRSAKPAAAKPVASWETRLADLEKRMDKILDQEFEEEFGTRRLSLLAKVEGLSKVLGVSVNGPLVTQIADLEKFLGVSPSEGGGLIGRLEALVPAVGKHVADKRKDRAKEKAENRLADAEKFLSERFKAPDLSKVPREERLAAVGSVLAKVKLGESDKKSLMRTLEAFEKHLDISPDPDATFDTRLAAVEAGAKRGRSLDQWLSDAAIRMSAIENVGK